MISFKDKVLLLLFCLFCTSMMAQLSENGIHRCHTIEAQENLKSKYPKLETTEEFERWLAPLVEQRKREGSRTGDCNNPIPIVFHIVHNGEAIGTGDNITASAVAAQIAQLNADFSLLGITFTPALINGTTDETDENRGKALAELGINRINRNDQGWSAPPFGSCFSNGLYNISYIENNIKTVQWDPNRYLNVWVADMVIPSSCGLLGYAQFPSSSGLSGLDENGGPASTDGVVILPSSVGSIANPNPNPAFPGLQPFTFGRTLTHELGHFFGLRHIWGDPDFGVDGCTVDDFCADTNNAQSPTSGCPNPEAPPFSCSSVDMFENYMDYTDDQCMSEFTNDQVARMDAVLANSPQRESLVKQLQVSFRVENAGGVKEDIFCYGEQVMIDGTVSSTPTNRYVEVKRRAIGTSNWTYIIGLATVNSVDFNFNNWYSNQGQSLQAGFEYSVKLAVQDNCDPWTEFIQTFQVQSNAAVSEFHFQDAQQNIREQFCSSETVFFNGTASEDEVRYRLEVGRAPIGTDIFTGLFLSSWRHTEVGTFNFNDFMIDEGFPLEEGFIYQVKLGVQNECDPWTETTHRFIFEDCCDAPIGLTCISVNNRTFLTWTGDPSATGFLLYIDPTSACCGNMDDTTPAGIFVPINQYSLKNINLSCFEWRVRSICNGELSPFSAPSCFNVLTPCFGEFAFEDNGNIDRPVENRPMISPNPTNGQIQIELMIEEPMQIKIDIYNTAGQLIQNLGAKNAHTGLFQTEWTAAPHLPNGIYIVQIQTPLGSFQEKVILTR